MADYIRHEVPRRYIDGTVGVYCRKCGREISRRAFSQIRSVNKCAICVLEAEGVTDAEKNVLPQYVMTDPFKPPMPLSAESAEVMFEIFPEERPAPGENPPPSGGIMGTAKSVYRAMGFAMEIAKEKIKALPKSRKVADRNKRKSVFDE